MSETFTYTVKLAAEGEDAVEHVLTFKPLSEIPTGILRRARKDPEEQLWGPFEWALSEDDLALLDLLPASTLPKILEAWQQASEIELGEFSKSSSLSVNGATAKPSKSTSSIPA